MKAIKVSIAGRELYLMFTGEAMFRMQDEFGGIDQLLEAMAPNTREGFNAVCRACAILAEQGELARRYLGYAQEHILSDKELQHLAMPTDVVALKQALPRVILLGYGREIKPEGDEVDLGLAELNQKNTT